MEYLRQKCLRASKKQSVAAAKATAKRKRMGQVNGMPDLFVPSLNLYIEMKRIKGGVVSAVQKKCHEGLRSQGAKVYLAKGFLDALREIERLEKKRNDNNWRELQRIS